jgi:apolipoprotein D and lipocalin family protein
MYKPVSGFDLQKYLGTWYEIARMPASFEMDLVAVTATYSLQDDGMVKVVNQGHKKALEGKKSIATGKAKFAGAKDIGHLKVSFFLWFYADYIIVNLDKDNYQYALVASSPKYLWILSRKPALDKGILDTLLDHAKSLGYDTSKLIMTPQEK